MIRKLYKICEALEKRFPGKRDPFRILARLMEESGELADQVHLRESVGRKREGGRKPEDMELAKEIQDVMTAVLDIARYYGIEEKLELRINTGYERAVNEGLIETLSIPGSGAV
jgi:NTP pyrophosphatase (non-canonical NTP hydrolase)